MWLIEDRVFPASEEVRLRTTLDTLHLDYRLLSTNELRDQVGQIGGLDMARGSCWWISLLMGHARWRRDLWGAIEDFAFSAYADRFGELLLNYPFNCLSFHELCWRGLESFTDSKGLFIRPDDGFKSFEGQVVKVDDFEPWMERTQLLQVRGSARIITATIREIRAEWRCLIVDGVIVGSSRYRPMLECDTPRDVIDFAVTAHKTAGAPCRCYVMDIADTTQGLRVVEIGCINCVAFYESDLNSAIPAIVKIVQ